MIYLLAALILSLASPAVEARETLPGWFIPLREAIYEQQLTADEIVPLYREISNIAGTTLSGAARYVMLSRCEYMMGRAFLFEGREREARTHFERGMEYAERALAIEESADAWVMRAENLSQNIVVRSRAYAMANGLNVERWARNALALEPRNAAAQYLIAARWVYAPAPFHNHRRGIQMMMDILENGDMQKDDQFNVYLSIGFAHIQQRNNAQAREWLYRAREIYPTNRFVQSLIDSL